MDNKTQNILQKFSKQKVELGLVEDAKKLITKIAAAQRTSNTIRDNAADIVGTLYSLRDKADSVRKRLDATIDDLKESVKKSERIIAQFKTTSKELGVEPNKIREYDMLNNSIGTIQAQIKNLESYRNDLKSIK